MKCEENGALRGSSPRKSRSTKQVARSGPPQRGLAQKRRDGVDRSLHSTTMLLTLSLSQRFSPQSHGHAINGRSEEHTSELQSLMRTSYAVFCLKKKNNKAHVQNPVNNEK